MIAEVKFKCGFVAHVVILCLKTSEQSRKIFALKSSNEVLNVSMSFFEFVTNNSILPDGINSVLM